MTELTTTTFDYETIDPETRISLKQRASRIGERTRRMATDIWENGREFAEAQQELASYGNGRFLAWIESETGYSKSTVYRMIDVHQRLDFPKLGKTDIAASALYLLASTSTPDAAREEVMSAAEQGEAISHSRAKEIVQAHKPEPTTEEINRGLFRACHSMAEADKRWQKRRETGLDDEGIKKALAYEWGLGGGGSGPDMTPISHKGGADPKFFYDSIAGREKPTLRGKALINAVRELMEIPYPQAETAVSTKYRCRWWKCSSGQRFTVPGDTMTCTTCGAKHEEGFSGTKLAPGEHDRLEALLLNGAGEQTATPMHEQVLQEVQHYEKEMEDWTPSPHHKLTNAIHAIETIAADKTLGIDVVGPLARALGPLYDAEKALKETAVSQEVQS